jgi:uncharacterized repeat protein (TIGR03843 family)
MGKTNRKKRDEEKIELEKAEIFELDFRADSIPEKLVTGQPTDLTISKAWRLALSAEELTAIMQRGNFGPLKLVSWGSNYTFITTLCDEQTKAEYAVIYKPRRGEVPLWDFPNGTLYKREYAAYLVSEALGWHFIPPVTIRDGPHGTGTVQIFIDANENVQYHEFHDSHAHELKRIAIFDLITNNADRKAGHCLLGLDGYIWGIDHGLCFNSVPKLRTIIWDYSGQSIPEDICHDLMEFTTNVERTTNLRHQLEELLERREVDLFFHRLEQVKESGIFPSLSSRRQIPWGMW